MGCSEFHQGGCDAFYSGFLFIGEESTHVQNAPLDSVTLVPLFGPSRKKDPLVFTMAIATSNKKIPLSTVAPGGTIIVFVLPRCFVTLKINDVIILSEGNFQGLHQAFHEGRFHKIGG